MSTVSLRGLLALFSEPVQVRVGPPGDVHEAMMLGVDATSLTVLVVQPDGGMEFVPLAWVETKWRWNPEAGDWDDLSWPVIGDDAADGAE